MDWSKAKQLLILTFLVLNVYLLFQILTQTWGTEVVTRGNTSITEQLEQRDVDVERLPEFSKDVGYLTGSVQEMSADMIDKQRKEQLVTTVDDTQLEVELRKAVPLNPDELQTTASTFLNNYVPFANEYSYWRYDEGTKQIFFVQTYGQNRIFSMPEVVIDANTSYIGPSLLVLQLNDRFEVTDYKQRHLTNIAIKEQDDLVLTAGEALAQLVGRKYFQPTQKLTDIKTGYYSLPLDQAGSLIIMPPLWSISIDDEAYFVNAIDGTVEQVTFAREEK